LGALLDMIVFGSVCALCLAVVAAIGALLGMTVFGQ